MANVRGKNHVMSIPLNLKGPAGQIAKYLDHEDKIRSQEPDSGTGQIVGMNF